MRVRALLPAVALVVTAGCGGSSSPAKAHPGVFLPPGQGPAPVVLLVPGGGWTAADPAGLVPLAERLAAAGAVAVTSTYRVYPKARFPAPVQDVLCAAAKAVAEARAAGRGGGPLVLVGHSAGGPLVLLAALRPAAFATTCDAPAVVPDAVVGLAGAYDLRQLQPQSLNLMGGPPATDPALWQRADVFAAVGQRPALPVLLVHGTADPIVPPTMTTRLAHALTAAGHPVRLEQPSGVDHAEVYGAGVAAPLIVDWLHRLGALRSPQPSSTP